MNPYDDLADERRQQYEADLEQVVTRAVFSEHGVLITWVEGGWSITVSDQVPYGHIYERHTP